MNIEVQPYLPDIKSWVISPIGDIPRKLEDRSLIYEMGLTPQDSSDPEWCIYMLTVIKEVENVITNKLVVDFKITYGYRIKKKGSLLTPLFLFELMKFGYNSFKKEYDTKTVGTNASHYIIDEPLYENCEKYLKSTIIMQGTSKQ